MKVVIPRAVRRVASIVVGVFFIIAGIISGFIPVVQGWIFILIGIYFIHAPFFHKIRRFAMKRLKGTWAEKWVGTEDGEKERGSAGGEAHGKRGQRGKSVERDRGEGSDRADSSGLQGGRGR